MPNFSPRSRDAKAALLIFFVAVIIYSNSLGGQFVYDDEYFVVRNIAIRSLTNFPSFFTKASSVAFADLAQDVYRPVTTISYALDYLFWKFNTFGYHLVNVVFHALNGILLYFLLLLVLSDPFIALIASLVFISHPIETEVVSWISGRSSVLFLFFYLASFIYYALFVKGRKPGCLILSIGAYLVSLFSKEMAVTLPLLLIAYDAHSAESGTLKERARRYLPYLLATGLFIGTRALVLGRMSQCGWWGASPYHTFLTMARVFVDYIRLLILPLKLCAFYILDVSTSIAEWPVTGSLALIAALFVTLPFIFRISRRASFAIWWFFITILPVSNIVPLKALEAERFLYLPSIGFCVLLAILADRIKTFSGRKVAAVLAAALVIAYSARTMMRNDDWKDPFSISKSIIEVSPLNPWAYTSLGVACMERGEYDEGMKALKKAISLSRDYVSPKSALGFCYLKLDRNEEAIELFNEVLRLKPNDLEAMNSLGVAYAKTKEYDKAAELFKRSIVIDPTFASAYFNLGAVYERRLENDKALEEYAKVGLVTKSSQEIAIAYIRTADVYKKTGQAEKAKAYYEKAANLCGRGFEELKQAALDRLKN